MMRLRLHSLRKAAPAAPVPDDPPSAPQHKPPAALPAGQIRPALPALPQDRAAPAIERAAPAAAGLRTRLSLRLLSFLVIVLIPTGLAAGYLFAIATDQYVAEFRFTLSSAGPPRFDPMSLLNGGPVQSSATLESQVLVQYITSRAIVDRIGAALDLRTLFSPPRADLWSRLWGPATIEELVRYWKGQVDAFYDPANGTVTARVRAFEPGQALRLAEAVVAACESLVNELSLRARRDALHHAEADLAQAETRLRSVLGQVRAFRDREGLIDPAKTAETTALLAARLRNEVIKAKAELATLKGYMRNNAPPVKLLTARIAALEEQRRMLAREMTDRDTTRSDTLSRTLGDYEQLESERKFAEAAYQLALRGVDQARADADRQRVFIASFVPPSLPEEPLYPRRWRALGTVALLAFAVWGIGGLAAQSVRDHLA